MKMNHFGKNARKLTRFENNRAKVDFLHCKNGYRDAAAIQMKTNRFEKIARKLNRFANKRTDLEIIARKLIFYTVKMDIAIRRRSK